VEAPEALSASLLLPREALVDAALEMPAAVAVTWPRY